MDRKRIPDTSDNKYKISYENYMDTNACTECTGLMAHPASNKEEWEIYQDVFRFSADSVCSPKKKSP